MKVIIDDFNHELIQLDLTKEQLDIVKYLRCNHINIGDSVIYSIEEMKFDKIGE